MAKSILVEVRPRYKDEPIEKMIKRFTRKVKKEKIIEGCLERKRYEKAAEKRKKEKRRRQKVLEKLHKKYNTNSTGH